MVWEPLLCPDTVTGGVGTTMSEFRQSMSPICFARLSKMKVSSEMKAVRWFHVAASVFKFGDIPAEVHVGKVDTGERFDKWEQDASKIAF